jgi:hypothetical protein
LCALIRQQARLGARRVELRTLLQYIQAGYRAEFMLRGNEIERFLLQHDRPVEHVGFRIEFAQREIVGCELRAQHEPGVREIVRRLLRGCAGRLDLAANASEEVRLVCDRGSYPNVVLNRRLIRHRIVQLRPVGRNALARDAT